jgi:hypothetical protein
MSVPVFLPKNKYHLSNTQTHSRIQKITLKFLTNHEFLTHKDKPLNFIMKRLTDHLPKKN